MNVSFGVSRKMINSFSSLCDDFYLDLYVNTEIELPSQRDTILAFFERIQKQFPSMGSFYRRQTNEYCLEEDRTKGRYRWVSLEADRINSGVVNPESFDEAYSQHQLILELIPYMLSVSHLDIDSMDVTFAMDFDCPVNHDEVITEALMGQSPFNCFFDLPNASAISCSPSIVYSLSEDRRTQARCSVESKTNIYEPDEKRQEQSQAITLSFTIRQYPPTDGKFDALKSFKNQCSLAQDLMADKIVPNFVKPLTNIIAQRKLK